MKCQKCHPVMNHRLILSGKSDPMSYVCSVCWAYHDSSGKLYDPDTKVHGDQWGTNAYCDNRKSQAVKNKVYESLINQFLIFSLK